MSLVQELCSESPARFPKPIGIKPEGDKVTRMEAETPRIEAGQVILPKDAPWLDTFLNEILAFPKSKHHDQVDSVSQFLAWAWKRANRMGTAPLAAPEIIVMEELPSFGRL